MADSSLVVENWSLTACGLRMHQVSVIVTYVPGKFEDKSNLRATDGLHLLLQMPCAGTFRWLVGCRRCACACRHRCVICGEAGHGAVNCLKRMYIQPTSRIRKISWKIAKSKNKEDDSNQCVVSYERFAAKEKKSAYLLRFRDIYIEIVCSRVVYSWIKLGGGGGFTIRFICINIKDKKKWVSGVFQSIEIKFQRSDKLCEFPTDT